MSEDTSGLHRRGAASTTVGGGRKEADVGEADRGGPAKADVGEADRGGREGGGPRRVRRPRGSLGRETILDAAERLAAAGFDGVTMRAVATELGAAPMALYNHFADKDALVDALLDRVLMRFQRSPPTGDWREDVKAFARTHRTLLTDHPWAVAQLFARPSPGLGAVRIGEHALQILRAAGFSSDGAVAVFSGVIALNYGWASFTTVRDESVGAALAQLPAEHFPLTLEAAAALGAYGSDEHYERVLAGMVAGLAP
jgi:AcrR family transcriptional regulator